MADKLGVDDALTESAVYLITAATAAIGMILTAGAQKLYKKLTAEEKAAIQPDIERAEREHLVLSKDDLDPLVVVVAGGAKEETDNKTSKKKKKAKK
jgi:hypothetical protein